MVRLPHVMMVRAVYLLRDFRLQIPPPFFSVGLLVIKFIFHSRLE